MPLETSLRDVVGRAHVLTDPDLTSAYETDWTRRFSGRARAVVRPADTAQVAAVVRDCADAGVPIVPQGGNTGLVGGGVPRPDGDPPVVLSTRRLSDIRDVDDRQLTAGAGVTIAAVQGAARHVGLTYGVDLASRDSATVGGTIGTNAGGVRVCRYGDTRRQVLGVEAVLADGSVVSRLVGLPKDSTGYDLSGLLVGSEGTLGVVTAARLRLWPRETPGSTVLVGCADIDEAVGLIPDNGLRAAEFMVAAGFELVRRVARLPHPLHRVWPVYLLLETDELPHIPADADAAVDDKLWVYREWHTESISTRGVPHKLDVAVPRHHLAKFCDEVATALAPYEVYLFGHINEGNVHVNVIGPAPDDDSITERVLEIVAAHHGSISAEHGIGVAKRQWLHLGRSRAEISAMRAIKRALDRDALLNPGVLLPD